MAGGCWYSFTRCIGNRGGEPVGTHYRTKEVETIKFENLLMVEQREKDARVPFVNESELQHVREGRLDRIAEEQMKIDRLKDEELRKQEEQLRLEEEAYYAAKRKAAKKSKQPITVQPSSSSQQIGARKKQNLPSWVTDSHSPNLAGSQKNSLQVAVELDDDEEDFDVFLKNVKAKSASLAKHSPEMASKLHSVTSDDEQLSEEEIDFGYWESASSKVEEQNDGVRSQGNLKEVDLNLL